MRHLQQRMEETARRYSQEGYFPSAVMTVFRQDGVLFQSTLGDARNDTLFDCASLTKIATATQVLLAVEQGLLQLDSALINLLPQVSEDAFLRQRLGHTTLFQLLTHTAGLPAWYPFYTGKEGFWPTLRAALASTPETGVVYSDIGFILLGKVLEELHQKPLEQCLQDNLVVPYQVGNMTYLPDKILDIMPSSYGNPIEENMVRDMGLSFDGWRPHTPITGQTNDGNAHYAFRGVSGHAGLFSDGRSLANLCRLYMNTVSPLMMSSMQEQASGRGLGWQVGDMYPKGCGHTGFTGTSLYVSPNLNIGCVLLTNRLFYPTGEAKQTAPFRRDIHQLAASFLG